MCVFILLKQYESIEVDRKTLLHVPSETMVNRQGHSSSGWNKKNIPNYYTWKSKMLCPIRVKWLRFAFLENSLNTRVKGVPTNIQRWRGTEPYRLQVQCRFGQCTLYSPHWLVLSQDCRTILYKAVWGLGTRPFVISIITVLRTVDVEKA